MINYLSGDATAPTIAGPKIIVHICNDVGVWGSGFVLAVSGRWPEPERVYRSAKSLVLGAIQTIQVELDIWVVNMIAQRGVRGENPLVRYWAVEACLAKVAEQARCLGASVHMPRIGCGRGGGQWSRIELLISKQLQGIEVYVYDFREEQR